MISTLQKLSLLSAFALALPLCAADPNMASADPGFEKGTKFFYIPKPRNFTSFVPEGRDKSMALKIANPGSSPVKRGGLYRKNFIPVEAGKTYTFEVDFKGSLTQGYASVLLSVFGEKNGKQSYIRSFETPRITDTKGEWNRLSCSFVIPEGGIKVHFGLFARNFTGSVLFDNVNMFEGDSYTLPLVEKGLALDGKFDAAFAAKALKFTDFQAYPVKNDQPPPEKTIVYLARTNDAIYGQALLFHAPGKVLKAKADKKDGALWADDSLEFFITRTNAPRPYYHFMFNTAGTVYDALESNKKWESSFRAKGGKRDAASHVIQFVLPLKDIGYDPELDAHLNKLEWKVNFTRNHRDMTPQYSTFAPVTVFREPASFIALESPGKNPAKEVWGRYRNKGVANAKNIRQQRFWKVEKPLYKELFSTKENPLKGESAFIWPRPIEEKRNVNFAIQYGMPYSLKNILKEYEKNRLHPYSSGDFPALAAFGKKTGVGFVQYAPYFLKNCSYIYDPATEKEFMDSIKTVLDQHSSGMWGVTIGDEAFSQTVRRIVTRGNDPKILAKEPALKKAVAEIRTKYGYGKYGLPKTLSADAPFAWIALRKWYFDRLLPMQKNLMAMAKKYKGSNGKPLTVISHDHVDWAILQYINRFAPYVDIMTAQSVPMNDPTRQNIGFRAKLLKDLSQKPVWLCIHVEPYSGSYTSEETAAFISEAARGGNTGLQIWNYDFIADQQGMGSSQFDYYGHRPRWNTIMDILERMRKDPLIAFPKEDYAILLSDISAFARPKMHMTQYESIYNLAGPGAGTSFRFISDTQLLDGQQKLENWKFVIVPKMDYLEEALIPLFQKYVSSGGILLSFDPRMMQFDPSGKTHEKARRELFGVKSIPVKNVSGMQFTQKAPFRKLAPNRSSLAVSDVQYALEKVDPAVEVWAEYQNKKAAMTVKKYPHGGMAILCSMEPKLYLSANKKWHEAFKEILSCFGAKTDHKFWRFQYPHKTEKQPEFKDKCLTGNHFYFWQNTVNAPANKRLHGAYYTYNIAPDGEKSAAKKYSFAEGRLTNRLKAPTAGDLANLKKSKQAIRSGKLHKGLFADTWSNKAPLEIAFDFGEKVTVKKMVLFWNGELPNGELVINGRSYPFKGARSAKFAVEKRELDLPAPKADKLLIKFAARKKGELLISEVEFWGK